MQGKHYKTKTGVRAREVIIVVLLLVVFLFVALPRWVTRDVSRDSAISFRNLQQWGIALNLYLIDNNNQMPEVGSPRIGENDANGWYNLLPPYLSLPPLADVPATERPRPGRPSIWMDPALTKMPPGSGTVFAYAMNRYLQPRINKPSLPVFNILEPARVVFLAEAAGFDPGLLPEQLVFRHPRRPGDPTLSAHVLFCDGHVERAVPGQFQTSRALPDGLDRTSVIFWPPNDPFVEPDRYELR